MNEWRDQTVVEALNADIKVTKSADESARFPIADDSPQLTPQAKRLLPWLVAVAFFMEALDTTILNTAVPTMAKALDVAPLSLKSVLTSYTLALAVFIPVSGWIAERFGTRRVFATAIGLFTLGSMLSGATNSLHLLVVCRIIQGIGGAMMVPVGRLTMVRAFARGEIVRAMSFVAIPALIGPLIGPLAGGLLVHYAHWRLIFFVNVPIGLLGLYMVWRHLPDYRAKDPHRLDVVGFVLFGAGVALLSYVLEVFGEHTLSGLEISGILGVALALLFTYGVHASRRRWPLLRLSLFSIRTFRASILGAFLARLGAGGMPFLLPLLYQVGLGYSAVQSGLLLLPQSIAAIGLRFIVPTILARVGFRTVLVFNTVAMGGIIALFSTVGAATPPAVIAVQGLFFGFCSSLQYSSMNTLVYADVPVQETSMASTLASTFQQLSLSFGVAVASLATALFVPDRFHSDSTQIVHGLHRALLTLGAVTALSAWLFFDLKKDDGANVSRHVTK